MSHAPVPGCDVQGSHERLRNIDRGCLGALLNPWRHRWVEFFR
jgi:hypothetical protein